MTYMACGPDPTNPTHPQATCMDIRAPVPRMVPSLSGCVEGCFCKPGYVQEGSKCINVEECGCFYNGSYVPVSWCWDVAVSHWLSVPQFQIGGCTVL